MCNIQHLSIGASSLIGFSISTLPLCFLSVSRLVSLFVSLTVSIYFGQEKEGKHKEEGRRGSGKRREKEKRRGKEKGGDSGLSQFSLTLSLSVTSMNEKKRNKKRGRRMGVWKRKGGSFVLYIGKGEK